MTRLRRRSIEIMAVGLPPHSLDVMTRLRRRCIETRENTLGRAQECRS